MRKGNMFLKRSGIAFAFVALILLALSPIQANDGAFAKINKQFSGHTIHYIDQASGEQHSIYFGRFGDFEKYFPCQYVDGTWWINAKGALCLKYSTEDQHKWCRKPQIRGSKVTFSSSSNEILLTAKIVGGNKLPFG